MRLVELNARKMGESIDSIKNNLMSGTYKITLKRGTSKVWEVFGRIEKEEGVEIENKVACRTCFSVMKFDPRTTSNLVKHKCYRITKEIDGKVEVNNETKKEGLKLICQWFTANCRPFQLIEDSGLKDFAMFMVRIGVKYGENVDIDKLLPHSTTVSRNIDTLFETTFSKVKHEISVNCKNGYGLTSGIFTDDYLRQSYLSLTIHYNKNGQLTSKLLGLISMDGVRNTGMKLIRMNLKLFECSFH